MQSLVRASFGSVALFLTVALAACAHDGPTQPAEVPKSCSGLSLDAPVSTASAMRILGVGCDTVRYQAEIAVRGNLAYTTSWGVRQLGGNKVSIWDVSGNVPVLVDSVLVNGATTTGDVAISDDGSLLVVATERAGGSIAIYDLADPKKPRLLSRFNNANTEPGVHTAEIGRVNGKLYGFLSIDPGATVGARLVIVDLSTPSAPREVYNKLAGRPYVHDTFVRDGLLFVALWDDGMQIWDIGAGGGGASPEAPRVLGTVKTAGGHVHNVWWYHDPAGSKRYAFVGEEGPGTVGSGSSGDIHVVDISDLTAPKEVAFYHVDGAGTHNFSVDETKGVLYAAYYNAGVRALDIRGDLGTCDPSQQDLIADLNLLRCNLRLTGRELATGLTDVGRVYVWGVDYLNGSLYVSDMLNGIWKLSAAK